MAKRCLCHQKLRAAVAGGMSFHDAYAKHSKRGVSHEHRCECACGCKRDTTGYAYCPTCHFDKACLAKRGEHIGILGMSFKRAP